MIDSFDIYSFQFYLAIPLKSAFFGEIQSLLWNFNELSLIREAPNTIKHNDGHHMLLVESNFKSTTI